MSIATVVVPTLATSRVLTSKRPRRGNQPLVHRSLMTTPLPVWVQNSLRNPTKGRSPWRNTGQSRRMPVR